VALGEPTPSSVTPEAGTRRPPAVRALERRKLEGYIAGTAQVTLERETSCVSWRDLCLELFEEAPVGPTGREASVRVRLVFGLSNWPPAA